MRWRGRALKGVGGTGEGGGGGRHGGVVGEEDVRGDRMTQRQPRWADRYGRAPERHPGTSGGEDGRGVGLGKVEVEKRRNA